jgi:peptide/nickel transport system permease protein
MKTIRRLCGDVGGLLGALIVSGIVIIALVGPLVAPHDPLKIDFSSVLKPPTKTHPFGTDEMGRDVFSRVLCGTRLSLVSAAVVLSMAIGLGCLIGSVAGVSRGIADNMLMRATDVFLAFPYLILAMAIAAAMGPGLFNAILAVGVVWWPSYARLVRGLVLVIREESYVEAARALGSSTPRIVVRHILPNCFSQLLAKATIDIGYAILTTASLSFIGLGAQAPSPEWGAMVAGGRTYIMSFWWAATFPGLVIFITVLGFSLLGDALEARTGSPR